MSPSPFVMEWLPRLTVGRALDLAMGRGRHALPLARAGFRVFGVDRDWPSVSAARHAAAAEGLSIAGWCADLTCTPLPRDRFDLVVVTRYLDRDRFGAIGAALVAGGTILYETFTTAQRAHGWGPTAATHLLAPGELRQRFAGFAIVFYEETSAPEAVARLVARRISAS